MNHLQPACLGHLVLLVLAKTGFPHLEEVSAYGCGWSKKGSSWQVAEVEAGFESDLESGQAKTSEPYFPIENDRTSRFLPLFY